MGTPAFNAGLNALRTVTIAFICIKSTVIVVPTENRCTVFPVMYKAKAEVIMERTGEKAVVHEAWYALETSVLSVEFEELGSLGAVFFVMALNGM